MVTLAHKVNSGRFFYEICIVHYNLQLGLIQRRDFVQGHRGRLYPTEGGMLRFQRVQGGREVRISGGLYYLQRRRCVSTTYIQVPFDILHTRVIIILHLLFTARDALVQSVSSTNEVLVATRWTTDQRIVLETSVEKERMLENLSLSTSM